MPFTPFHMGAGLIAKAALGKRFSLVSFGLAQILMDIEPGVRMIRDDAVLHWVSHTLWGAVAIGVLAALISPWLIKVIVARYNSEVAHYKIANWAYSQSIRPSAIWLGAFFGTFSHILLDGLIHADMSPFAPLIASNPLLNMVAHDDVYWIMAVCSATGAALWLLRWRISFYARSADHTMRRQKKPISRTRRILTWTLFLIFVIVPILWFYSIYTDYYIKIEQRENSLIMQPAPENSSD